MSSPITEEIRNRINLWLQSADEENHKAVSELEQNDPNALADAFYTDLEFGTGGLRGIMGPGTNRMNQQTVSYATQGLANYLRKSYGDQPMSVAIAFDCRNQSEYFAKVAASVLSGNGINVFIFKELRPTPELSFAVRELKCQAGIVITASHNPKEYNGYKVYWEDGAQLIAPHDVNVIAEVRAVTENLSKGIGKIPEGNERLIQWLGDEFDDIYLNKLLSLRISENEIRNCHEMGIVYTPLHGTGVKLVPEGLRRWGFTNVIHVPEQDINDGNFPTLASPNPEEQAALAMAIEKAKATKADIVLATDPDADRVGVAVRLDNGEYLLLNGNQTAAILVYYMLCHRFETGTLGVNPYIVQTIVTTDLLAKIADGFDVKTYSVLTGFKYIADIIRSKEGTETYICGGEESYGFLAGDFVRDKDAISASCLIAEAAAWAKNNGMNLHHLLLKIFRLFGFYQEQLISLTRKGMDGIAEINAMMERYRASVPTEIAGSKVIRFADYRSGTIMDIETESTCETGLPSSNVLQFWLADGSKVTMRPSGTEPKIKFYFSVSAKSGDYRVIKPILDQRLQELVAFFS